jgi:ligand-binding sensor domain-containing protein
MKSKFIFLILLFISYFNQYGQAGVGDWTTFTSQNDIRDLILIGDHIWCATNGGVFSYQISAGIYQQFNNTNGLTSVDAQTIEIDYKGNFWVGFADGWINYYDPDSKTWKSVQDFLGHYIYDLEAVGDSLLIALDIGISLYDIRRKEVKETYKRLGWQLNSEVDVTDIMVVDREIWAATGSGIARSSFDLANLMAPESWKNYTSIQGLPGNEIQSLVSHEDSIYAGTNVGIAVFRGQGWIEISTGLDNRDIKRLVSQNGELFAVSSEYISRWNPPENRWRNVAPWFPVMSCLVVMENGDLWVGRKKSGYGSGFAKFSTSNQQWERFNPPGPPSNEFNGLAVDEDGILWCASARDGIFRYDGKTWRQFTTADGLINNGIKSVTVDSENRKWFGSVGGGLIMIDTHETIRIFYKEVLSGAGSSQDWIVVPDVKIDQYNNVWVLNTEANDNEVVAVYTPQLDWYYFTVQEGILSNVVTSLDIDQADRVWIGTQRGVSVIDYNNTLADKSDDRVEGNNLTTVDGLENNSINDIAVDQDEIVWIATAGGLNYWYWDRDEQKGVVKTQYGLLSNSINTIEIDIRNNKWFGTSAGVSILAPDGYTFTHYSTDNSLLVNDNVTSFGFDFETGKVYIGTSNGLSVLETPYSRPREDLSQVKAGPNPFIVGQGQGFAISDLSDDVSIKFMTENGMVVRHISKDDILGAYTTWNGKNDMGEYVASGIYIYVIYNEETGLNRVGKVAVIR